jgi:hypothetical protein
MTNTIGDGGKSTAGQGRDGIGYAAVNTVIYYYITLIWAVRAVFYSGATTPCGWLTKAISSFNCDFGWNTHFDGFFDGF